VSRAKARAVDHELLAAAYDVDDAELAVIQRRPPQAGDQARMVSVAEVRRSAYQPGGRPSERAVRAVAEAIDATGSVRALMEDTGARVLAALDREARALAELTADIAEHGVESPLEARRVAGGLELLSGHRRLAAARLAGVAEVPVVDRGEMADHVAAAIVYRRNLLRKDFTAWQEATSFAAIRDNRRAAGMPDSVRELARALGCSHGRAGDLLGIARAFPEPLLERLGDGDAEAASEGLARLSFRALRSLASTESELARLAAAREQTGLGATEPAARKAGRPGPLEQVRRRGGGFALIVRKPVARLTIAEAREVLAAFEEQVRALKGRLGER
jgi:ParB family transcriptional regulator, chromosome partitioning protein